MGTGGGAAAAAVLFPTRGNHITDRVVSGRIGIGTQPRRSEQTPAGRAGPCPVVSWPGCLQDDGVTTPFSDSLRRLKLPRSGSLRQSAATTVPGQSPGQPGRPGGGHSLGPCPKVASATEVTPACPPLSRPRWSHSCPRASTPGRRHSPGVHIDPTPCCVPGPVAPWHLRPHCPRKQLRPGCPPLPGARAHIRMSAHTCSQTQA